jgi:hypothetical protein
MGDNVIDYGQYGYRHWQPNVGPMFPLGRPQDLVRLTVRATKQVGGGYVTYPTVNFNTLDEAKAFVAAIKAGEFTVNGLQEVKIEGKDL